MSKFLCALLSVLMATFCLSTQAQTLLLTPQSGVYEAANLSGHLAARRDASGLLEIEEATAPGNAGKFAALPGFLGAGYTADTYWLRFTLQRTTDTTSHWFIEVSPPYLNDVTLFVPRRDGTFEATRLGDLRPYTERPVPHRSFVFPLRLADDQPLTLYLRVKTSSTMQVRVAAWQYEGLLAATQTDTSFYSAYLGLLALGFMSSLVFWLWLRERVYLSYCAYLAALAAVMMATGGFVSQWLFPQVPLVANRLVGVAVCAVYLLGTQFFIHVLRLREHFPRLRRLFDALLLFYTACGLLAIAGYYGVLATGLHLVLIVVTMGIALAGPWLLWRGHREYLLYTLAFTTNFVSLAFTIARILGWISTQVPTDYTTMLSTTVHVILINFAVADRVRRADREKLEAEKQTARLTAEHESVQQQRQFIAMVSHEFRTPLAVIDATAQSIEIACSQMSCAIVGSVMPRQEKIRRAVRRLVSLLDNFLTHERIDFKEAQIKPKALDLRDLASEAVNSWQHLLPPSAQLQLELGSEPATALVDRAMMMLALSNLIDNAIKYAPPGSPITLRVGKTKDNGWVEVHDCGVGIAAPYLEKIFDKFYRSDEALAVPGAGLGLYLVRTLLHQHGGEVEVTSEPGKGSTFRLHLPLVKYLI